MNIDSRRLSDPEKLLFSCGVTSPSHIDLEAIAAHHNVDVVYRQLDGCEARMVRSADRAVISVNASANPGRKRFSLAHEIAHFICDKGRTAFSCASSDIGPQNASAKSVETSANAYASQLVLPSYLVRQESAGRLTSLAGANRIHDIFDVSITAAALKLIHLTQEQACVIVHSRGQMRWFRKSLTFPADAYVLQELPSETEAFTMSFGGARRLTPARRGPADRWFSASGMSIREVEHQSLGIADGEVVTMLRMTR